jgi:hypothetical protein
MQKPTFISIHSSVALQPFVGPWPPQLRNIFTQMVGLLRRVISPSQGRYLNTGQHKHRINAHTDFTPRVGFEPTIPAFERAKTVHVLDRTATVTGTFISSCVHIRQHTMRCLFTICFGHHRL